MLTLHNLLKPRHCIEKYSVVGSNYNKLLQTELASMQTTLASSGVHIAFVDTFAIATEFVQNPSKYGIYITPLLLHLSKSFYVAIDYILLFHN